MERFTSETYTGRPRHFRSEEDMYEWEANHQPEPEDEPEAEDEPEPVEAQVVSACCGAPFTYRQYSNGVDAQTGYHDDGETCICLVCGEETEPELAAAASRKPVQQAQGELPFQTEVA